VLVGVPSGVRVVVCDGEPVTETVADTVVVLETVGVTVVDMDTVPVGDNVAVVETVPLGDGVVEIEDDDDTLGDEDVDAEAVASEDFVEENDGHEAVGETVTDCVGEPDTDPVVETVGEGEPDADAEGDVVT